MDRMTRADNLWHMYRLQKKRLTGKVTHVVFWLVKRNTFSDYLVGGVGGKGYCG